MTFSFCAVSLKVVHFLGEGSSKHAADDSGSMKIGKRIATLTKTLQSVADWATRLEPRGISVRFLNHEGDSDQHFDGLVDVPTIQDRIYKVKFGGGTMLGTMLDEKIINPFLLRMERLENKRPLIAVIITDGEVCFGAVRRSLGK
jgi:hypothetical protein